MLNEYTDLNLTCMNLPNDTAGYCDPLGNFDSPEDMETSMYILAIMYAGCYTLSLIIMKLLSTKYEWYRENDFKIQ